MSPIRFIHIGDVHLGEKYYDRASDLENSFFNAIEIGIEKDADAVLFSGDIFASPFPSPQTLETVYKGIKRLIDRRINVVILPGNHDLPVRQEKGHILSPLKTLEIDKLKIADSIEIFRVESKRGAFEILSLPYPNLAKLVQTYPKLGEVKSNALMKIAQRAFIAKLLHLSRQRNPEFPLVLLAHIYVLGAQGYPGFHSSIGSEEIVFPREYLYKLPLTYAALGHLHTFQNLNINGQFPIVYAGSIDRITFSEEHERKGVVLVELDNSSGNWNAQFQFIPLKTRSFRTIEVDIRDKSSPMVEIKNSITACIIDSAVVRLNIKLRHGEEKGINLTKLKELLEKAYRYKIYWLYEEPLKKKPELKLDWSNPITAIESFIEQNPELKVKKFELMAIAEKFYKEIQEQNEE